MPRPMQRLFIPFIVLSCVSIAISITIFGLSLADKGFGARYTNIIMPILTITYHITILKSHYSFIKRTDGTDDTDGTVRHHPAGTTVNIVCVGCLVALWYLPFGLIIGLPHPKNPPVTLWVQMGLDSGEAGILWSLFGNAIGIKRGHVPRWGCMRNRKYVLFFASAASLDSFFDSSENKSPA
jgi:hypothetical protein